MTSNLALICRGLAVSLCVGPAAGAENWPEFRGPTGQGLVRAGSLPTQWSSSKNVAWKTAIPGKGWSSPVVVDGRVYLTTAVPMSDVPNADQSLRALCLDAETGNLVWQQEVFRQDGKTAPPIQPKNSHASPTAIVDRGQLFVHFGHQGTACLDLSGKLLWANRSFRYLPVHGNGGSPVLVDDALVFSCDGGDQQFVVALDRNTGKTLWKTDRRTSGFKRFAFCTPLVITVNGQKQIISPGANVVCAYEPKSGREIWRVRYDGYSVVPRPVYGHGLVFLSTGYDTPTLLAIRADGQGDVTDTHVAWTTRRGAPHNPSPLLVDDELYLVSDSGVAGCTDAKTGEVYWQQRLGDNYSASPIHADGRIYFQSEEGTGTVVRAGKQFERLATNDLGERTLASYAVVDGSLLIRTEGHLYRISNPQETR